MASSWLELELKPALTPDKIGHLCTIQSILVLDQECWCNYVFWITARTNVVIEYVSTPTEQSH